MAGGTDLALLRELVGRVLNDFAGLWRHQDIGVECERLGLPKPPAADECSKRERVSRSLAGLPDADLPEVARRIVTSTMPLSSGPAVRYAIEDVLWAGQGRHRDSQEDPARARPGPGPRRPRGQGRPVMALLERLWVLDTPFGTWPDRSPTLRGRIDRHLFCNPGDWSAEDLFEELGAFEAGDARFSKFLEGLVCSEVVPDEPAQRRIADIVNLHLRSAGAELRETGTDGGYPLFSVISTRTAQARRPKNLIFATLAKPDIRFTDAVDNDIEIVENADKVLVYDRPIGAGGLRWRDLQAWWKDTQHIANDAEAKKALYYSLGRSLPGNSPAQRNLFELYHEIHGTAVPGLPALLPEVWLHWDPKTVRERGLKAMLGLRMDFLLLPPQSRRIVLEVDGSQHFTGADGQPDAAKYAVGLRGDRDLKLSGYEVFRFGAAELQDREQARTLLGQFFADLFRRFGVTSSTS